MYGKPEEKKLPFPLWDAQFPMIDCSKCEFYEQTFKVRSSCNRSPSSSWAIYTPYRNIRVVFEVTDIIAAVIFDPRCCLEAIVGSEDNKNTLSGNELMYGGLGIYDVKGSLCFFWKFALPPFSPSLPSVVEISKPNRHRTFDIINT